MRFPTNVHFPSLLSTTVNRVLAIETYWFINSNALQCEPQCQYVVGMFCADDTEELYSTPGTAFFELHVIEWRFAGSKYLNSFSCEKWQKWTNGPQYLI